MSQFNENTSVEINSLICNEEIWKSCIAQFLQPVHGYSVILISIVYKVISSTNSMILSNMCYYFASIQSCSHQRLWRYWKFCRYSCVYIQLRLSEWVSYESKGPLYSSKLRVLIKELKQNIIRDQIFCVNSSGLFWGFFIFFLAYLSQRLKWAFF